MIIAYNVIFSLTLATYIIVAFNAEFIANLIAVRLYHRFKWRALVALVIKVYSWLIVLTSAKLLLLQQFERTVNTKQVLYLMLDVQNVILIVTLTIMAISQRRKHDIK